MTIWGYARCSTNELKQNIDSQIRELKEQGHIYKRTNRKERRL